MTAADLLLIIIEEIFYSWQEAILILTMIVSGDFVIAMTFDPLTCVVFWYGSNSAQNVIIHV